MFVSKLALPRRTILRGLGSAVALPFLDAMIPALTPMAKAAGAPRMRFGAVYFPNGAIMQQFTPKAFGEGFEFTPILKPLEPFRDHLAVVTNLTRSHPGSQVGDHAVSCAGFLTGGRASNSQSYRNPRLSVSFGRTRHSSSTKPARSKMSGYTVVPGVPSPEKA